MITAAYIKGVQDCLVQNDLVRYASEEDAQQDVERLALAFESELPIDQAKLAQEGTTAFETDIVAQALSEMSTVEKTAELNNVVRGAIHVLSEKTASSPDNNNVVAGHEPGSVAAGESVAKKEDLNKELTNAVPATAERPEHWSSMPGKQKDGDKGHIGTEAAAVGANAQGPVVGDNQELVNKVPNTRERPNYHGGPGDQKDEDKGHIGTEKAASLSDYLARI